MVKDGGGRRRLGNPAVAVRKQSDMVHQHGAGNAITVHCHLARTGA